MTDEELAGWARNWHWNDCAEDKPVDPSIYFRDMRMLKAFQAASHGSAGGEHDPADVWENYIGEVDPEHRSLQGALAFGFAAALSPPVKTGGEAETLEKIEAEARRYAEMYPQSSDGRNTFVIFADWVAALSRPSTGREADTSLQNLQTSPTEQEYLADNIATVAWHLGRPGARMRVDNDMCGLAVDPGEVLKEVSRRLTAPAQAAPKPLAKIRHRGIFIERQGTGGVYRYICHTGILKFLPDLYDTQTDAIKAVDAKLDAAPSVSSAQLGGPNGN